MIGGREMEKKYPYNYNEEWEDSSAKAMTLAAYAPPEFMGLIRDGAGFYGQSDTDGTYGAPKPRGGRNNV